MSGCMCCDEYQQMNSFLILPRGVSRQGDSFRFIWAGFEISASDLNASAPIQWRWKAFHLWCSQHWKHLKESAASLFLFQLSVLFGSTFAEVPRKTADSEDCGLSKHSRKTCCCWIFLRWAPQIKFYLLGWRQTLRTWITNIWPN